MEEVFSVKDKKNRAYVLRFKTELSRADPQEGISKCHCNEIESAYQQLEPAKDFYYAEWLEWQTSKKVETVLLCIRCGFEGYPSEFSQIGVIEIITITLNGCKRTYGYLWNFDLKYSRLNNLELSGPILHLTEHFLKERKVEYLCGFTIKKGVLGFWKKMGYSILNGREIYKKFR
jgi:hypothetical protein